LFKNAIEDTRLESIGGHNVRLLFENRKQQIENCLAQNKKTVEKKQGQISAYEMFVLENNLYLNYEFGFYHDKFSLNDNLFPHFVVDIHDKRHAKSDLFSEHIYYCFHIFNQIVEIYTTSRFMYFQAITKDYSSMDKKIGFMYTFDYVIHGMKCGLLKIIYSNLYNCLDKIARMCNLYFMEDKRDMKKDIQFHDLLANNFKDMIIQKNNFQLLALYNLALDFEDGHQYYPLRKYRNKITHSFLNISDDLCYSEVYSDYETTEKKLVEHTNQLFVIVKAALLYFTLAVEHTKPNIELGSMRPVFEKDIYF
jgi:hypothetical protein